VSNCVVWKIRRAARVLTRLYDEALAPSGLTSVQLGTLDVLSEMGPSTLAQIAEANGHERSATWRGLQPLIRKEFVRQSQTRGRAGRYEISETGVEVLKTALMHWREMQQRVLAELGGDIDDLTAKVDALETEKRSPRRRRAASSLTT
jgi:DNA-binding MarR family transcriptional regulator